MEAYDFEPLIKREFSAMCKGIKSQVKETYFQRLSSLVHFDLLDSSWVNIMNTYFSEHYTAEFLPAEYEKNYEIIDRGVIKRDDVTSHLLIFVDGDITKHDIVRTKLEYEQESAYLVLPHQQPGYRRSMRYLIDKIMRQGQIMRCTDMHFEPVAKAGGGFHYRIKFRKGIYLEEITGDINLVASEMDAILEDMIKNRSRASFKAIQPQTETKVSFSLVDPLYLVRCEVARTIGGPMLIIRLLPGETPFRVKDLGFDEKTEAILQELSFIPSGLSLISGVIGSGKGTTVNAVALDINDANMFSMVSVDNPIEYLGSFPQIEYTSQKQLYEITNSIKKQDRNFVLLNEIATTETARQVYNLVVSGVHVITTIHNNRVYRVMYKLQEMLGDLYNNIIPYLNLVSYQDKYSNTCQECLQRIDISNYNDEPLKKQFLTFLNLTSISQPHGCSACAQTGIMKTGIQVVSEFLYFGTELKDKLLRADIHEQSRILETALKESINLETVISQKLSTGKVLLKEAYSKLDSWR